MENKYICTGCGHTFSRQQILTAYIENETVILKCPLCQKKNIIREAAFCDCNLGQIGQGCPKKAEFLFPYESDKGIVFQSLCRDHIRTGGIPFGCRCLPETNKAVENAYETIHPVLWSFFKTWMIFVFAGGPILWMYFIAGGLGFRFFAMTRFSFAFLLFGILWIVLSKSEYIKISENLNKRILKILTAILILIMILEITLNLL